MRDGALSYCVVNTNGRDYLLACLDAIERTHPPGVEHEVLVLDNCSDDGSVAAVEDERPRRARDRARPAHRQGRERLDPAARGARALLPAAERGLRAARRARPPRCSRRSRRDPRAAAAGAQLLSSEGERKACAWRLPGVAAALAGALFLHRLFTVQSRGAAHAAGRAGRSRARCWCGARRRPTSDYLDPDFFVYSDETDFCKRLHDAGWERALRARRRGGPPRPADHRPARARGGGSWSSTATATATCASTTARPSGYLVRALGVWFYLVLALAARWRRPGHDPRRYLLHARQELTPGRGEGIREAAEEYNRRSRIAP